MGSSALYPKAVSSLGKTLYWTAAQTIFEQTTGQKVHTSPTGVVTGAHSGLPAARSQAEKMVFGLGANIASVLTGPSNITQHEPTPTPKPAIPLGTFTQLLSQTGVNLHGKTVPINFLAHNPIFQQATQAQNSIAPAGQVTDGAVNVLQGYVRSHMKLVEPSTQNATANLK
jgi:hypothetical protein